MDHGRHHPREHRVTRDLLLVLWLLAAGMLFAWGRRRTALGRRVRGLLDPRREAAPGLAQRLRTRIEMAAAVAPDRKRELRMHRAGISGAMATGGFRMLFAALPPLLCVLIPLLLIESGTRGRRELLLAAAAGLFAGYALPRLWLANRTARRQRQLEIELPDALDLMAVCMEAGLSLDAALSRVAREMNGSAPTLAAELGLMRTELSFLPDRQAAFANLTERVPIPPFRRFASVLQQTERLGTPLAVAIETLARDYRMEATMLIEEKAGRLPAILTVPMILLLVPALFIILLGPAILQLLAITG